jgi:hypothetical protein
MTIAFQTRVDFGYSFATPHRLTVAVPNSPNKTLLDVSPGYFRMAWTYEDLSHFPLFAFLTPTTRWELKLVANIDGQPFAKNTWTRIKGYFPALDNTYMDGRGMMKLEVVGGVMAAITRITVTNTADRPHVFALVCEKPGHWAGMNPGWVDPSEPANLLLAGWLDQADRVLVLGLGADEYIARSATTLCMSWRLNPGESRTGWLIRPYRAYAPDIATLTGLDWEDLYQQGLNVWRSLLDQALQLQIPDTSVLNAYKACLCDLFVMREPLADGRIVGTPGTEVYRAPNSYEAGIVAIALDQVGLHGEAEAGYKIPLSLQEVDGNWTEPKGWAHLMWGGSGFKSWVAMEHYHLTGDLDYLRKVYPRMVASSRWQDHMRAKTRTPQNDELTYGLMPRGMGDCGLKDGDDLYGVFIPHNIWAVYADKLALEAACILGRNDDLPELERIYQTGLGDLLRVMDRGAIKEKEYRWIPGVPGKTSGSRWGVLNALYPCGHLAPDHELIEGTLRHIEAQLSPGGIPINTGWMTDGMWVAITLDNIAEAHLVRGNGDVAAEYLYSMLNHGTPLYTWCEERGQEPYTEKTSGDRQHLWTPVAVVRTIRDSFIMERGTELHLGLGISRSWLASGMPVGVTEAATHFGQVTYQLTYDLNTEKITGHIEFPNRSTMTTASLSIRLPYGRKIVVVRSVKGIMPTYDERALHWQQPQGEATFEISIGRM